MIKVRDLCLHQINVTIFGFLVTSPEVQQVKLPLQCTADEVIPSQPAIKEEEEEKVVEVSNFKDGFEVFNQPHSPKALTGDLRHIPPVQASHVQEDPNIPEVMVL